jgi:hypothetical protein
MVIRRFDLRVWSRAGDCQNLATAAAKPSAASEIGDFRLFSLRSCSHTSTDLHAVCSSWPELPEVASDVNAGIAENVMGLALRAIDSAYRAAA